MIDMIPGGWHSYYLQDIIVMILLVSLVLVVRDMRRKDYWRRAFKQVFDRVLIRVCFGILCLYSLIAVLDSVGWHLPLKDERGKIRRGEETGRIIYDDKGLSALDAVLTPIRRAKEKTYSAPLAEYQLTRETVLREDGTVTRERPGLRYPRCHVLGTDIIGKDVLYKALKSVRVGMIIGVVTVLIIIPFAILFGVVAGYFGGWVDDVIAYVYTVLASIPWVLLVVAFMMAFGRGLPQLCVAMGITSWTGLCRVLRGETMRLREMEYVQAARAMGVSRFRIMMRHIVPNVMHVILITSVLGFSGLVMAEIVLTYIGIGVGGDTVSWGAMINDARNELAQSPMVWWNIFAAFLFMIGLVLPANMFGDAVRDALDPRLRTR